MPCVLFGLYNKLYYLFRLWMIFAKKYWVWKDQRQKTLSHPSNYVQIHLNLVVFFWKSQLKKSLLGNIFFLYIYIHAFLRKRGEVKLFQIWHYIRIHKNCNLTISALFQVPHPWGEGGGSKNVIVLPFILQGLHQS